MKQSVGSAFLYNIIIVFIVIIFAFLFGIVGYYKAYKVNSKIVGIIEKYEGYNALAVSEISNTLRTIGYEIDNKWNCPKKEGKTAISSGQDHRYCVYYFDKGKHYNYGVVSYIIIQLPVIGTEINLPIYSKSIDLYKFS